MRTKLMLKLVNLSTRFMMMRFGNVVAVARKPIYFKDRGNNYLGLC